MVLCQTCCSFPLASHCASQAQEFCYLSEMVDSNYLTEQHALLNVSMLWWISSSSSVRWIQIVAILSYSRQEV